MRLVIWVREFLVGCTQRVRVEGQLAQEVKVNSGVPQGSVLGPLLFLVYINDILRNIDLSIRLFADRKITNKNDTEKLQKDLDTLGEWAIENGMKINPVKSKAINLRELGLKVHWVTLLVLIKYRKQAAVNTWE